AVDVLLVAPPRRRDQVESGRDHAPVHPDRAAAPLVGLRPAEVPTDAAHRGDVVLGRCDRSVAQPAVVERLVDGQHGVETVVGDDLVAVGHRRVPRPDTTAKRPWSQWVVSFFVAPPPGGTWGGIRGVGYCPSRIRIAGM